MRAHLRKHELGWIPVKRIRFAEPSGIHFRWQCAYYDITFFPEAFRLMHSADEVYIFPVTYPSLQSTRLHMYQDLDPHADRKHSRLLDARARREVTSLLGREKSWSGAMDDTVSGYAEPPNIGLRFRKNSSEITLLFSSGSDRADGPFNGERTGGLLAFPAAKKMDEWKKRYAQLELPSAQNPNQ